MKGVSHNNVKSKKYNAQCSHLVQLPFSLLIKVYRNSGLNP